MNIKDLLVFIGKTEVQRIYHKSKVVYGAPDPRLKLICEECIPKMNIKDSALIKTVVTTKTPLVNDVLPKMNIKDSVTIMLKEGSVV